jgi:hypothetical protein
MKAPSVGKPVSGGGNAGPAGVNLAKLRGQLQAVEAEAASLNAILKDPKRKGEHAAAYQRLHGAPAGQAPAPGTVNSRFLAAQARLRTAEQGVKRGAVSEAQLNEPQTFDFVTNRRRSEPPGLGERVFSFLADSHFAGGMEVTRSAKADYHRAVLAGTAAPPPQARSDREYQMLRRLNAASDTFYKEVIRPYSFKLHPTFANDGTESDAGFRDPRVMRKWEEFPAWLASRQRDPLPDSVLQGAVALKDLAKIQRASALKLRNALTTDVAVAAGMAWAGEQVQPWMARQVSKPAARLINSGAGKFTQTMLNKGEGTVAGRLGAGVVRRVANREVAASGLTGGLLTVPQHAITQKMVHPEKSNGRIMRESLEAGAKAVPIAGLFHVGQSGLGELTDHASTLVRRWRAEPLDLGTGVRFYTKEGKKKLARVVEVKRGGMYRLSNGITAPRERLEIISPRKPLSQPEVGTGQTLRLPPDDPMLDNSVLSELALRGPDGRRLGSAQRFGDRRRGKLSVTQTQKKEFLEERSLAEFEALVREFGIVEVPDPDPAEVAALMKRLKITSNLRYNDILALTAARQHKVPLSTGDRSLFSAALRLAKQYGESTAPVEYRKFEGTRSQQLTAYSKARRQVRSNAPLGNDPYTYTGSPTRGKPRN